MGFWGAFLDLGMVETLEEWRRIRLYKKIGKKLDQMSVQEINGMLKNEK